MTPTMWLCVLMVVLGIVFIAVSFAPPHDPGDGELFGAGCFTIVLGCVLMVFEKAGGMLP